MRTSGHQSLRIRLIRLTAVAVLVAMVATLATVALFEITTFRPRALQNARTQADLIAEIIVPALEFDDARTAENLLSVLKHEQAVDAAGVYRADGGLLADYQRPGTTVILPADLPERQDSIDGRKVIISVKVAVEGTTIGRVWLQASLPGMMDRLNQYGLLLLLVALAVVVLSLAISFLARRQITDPLHALAETARQVGQNRDLQLRVPETDSGEIGDLAHSFNVMLQTLAEQDLHQRDRELRLARQNQGLVDMARAQQEQPEDSAAQSRRMTEILCSALNVGRSGLWLFNADQSSLICRDLYEFGAQRHVSGAIIQIARYPVFFSAFKKERVIEATDARSDPRTCEFNQEYSIPLGVGAMLDVPVWWRGQLVGILCLEHVGGSRLWQPDEISFAISAADRVALFLEAEESHQAARALQDSEQRYRNLIGEARDAIFTLDTDGKIMDLNQAVETITGWRPELWVGRNFTDPLLPQDRQKARDLFKEIVRGGRPPSFELQIRSRTGSMVTIEFAMSPRYEKGVVVGLLGVGRDVTERRLAQEAQTKLETQLRQSQKMEAIGNLAGGIAHDFNNILTAIIGHTQLAVMDLAPDDHAAREALGNTLAAAQRAKELVNQILAFSRQQEKKQNPLQLGVVVQESMKLLRPALPSTIEIIIRESPHLPPIMADSTQIHQVVVNLATNAAHVMEATGGLMELVVDTVAVDEEMVRQHPQLKTGSYVRLVVSDTGTGMDDATVQRIFEPFFTTKETGKGTGLGLAVVHGIVQQHDGAIVVDSEPGKGTRFQLYFAAFAGGTDVQVEAPAAATPGSDRKGTGQTIMVVDDESLVLSVADRLLRRSGYQTEPFDDPVEALRVFRKNPGKYDLLITDLTMPRLKGTALAAECRQLRPDIPVILTTGFEGGLKPGEIKIPGQHGLLQKPFTSESLLGATLTALSDGTV